MPILERTQYELFARLKAEGKSTTQAAIDAGYSPKTAAAQGSRLLKNVEIKERIEELVAETTDRVLEKTALTESYVITGLMRNAEHTGDPRSKHYNPAAANRSLELLGKTLAMFVERRQEEKRYTDLTSVEEMEQAVDEMNQEIEALLARRQALLDGKD